jgi:hypothetical protein
MALTRTRLIYIAAVLIGNKQEAPSYEYFCEVKLLK